MIDFTLNYKLWKNGRVIRTGTMKVRNRLSRLHAMSALEDHLKKTYAFDKMTAKDQALKLGLPDCFKDIFPGL